MNIFESLCQWILIFKRLFLNFVQTVQFRNNKIIVRRDCVQAGADLISLIKMH